MTHIHFYRKLAREDPTFLYIKKIIHKLQGYSLYPKKQRRNINYSIIHLITFWSGFAPSVTRQSSSLKCVIQKITIVK